MTNKNIVKPRGTDDDPGLPHKTGEDAAVWEVRGRVKSIGNSNVVNEYSYLDIFRDETTETYYYQIRQTDFDGTSKTSGIVKVQLGGKEPQAVSVFPNPVQTSFVVAHPFVEGVTLELIKADGFDGLSLSDYKTGSEIDVRQLPAGLYLLRLSHGGQTLYTHKVYVFH